MAETISLEVKGKVPEGLLNRLYAKVTPVYVTDLLTRNEMPTDRETVDNVVHSYASGFPTQDLALKAFQTKGGMKFWGTASGSANRPEKMAVKYLILEHVQSELAGAGIESELNIADLNRETVEYLEARGIFKGNLPKLREVAKRKGRLEDLAIGVYAAAVTPV